MHARSENDYEGRRRNHNNRSGIYASGTRSEEDGEEWECEPQYGHASGAANGRSGGRKVSGGGGGDGIASMWERWAGGTQGVFAGDGGACGIRAVQCLCSFDWRADEQERGSFQYAQALCCR